MNRYKALLSVLLLAAFCFSSCSGLKTACTVNCGGSGNGNLTLTLFDAPPLNASFLSFNVPVIGISLTPQSGPNFTVFSPPNPVSFEITRLQSDSSLIGTLSVPVGTYTKMNFSLNPASSVFINSSNATIGSCKANSVCNLNSAGSVAVSVTLGAPLIVTSGANLTLGVEFNLNNAVTTQNGITIDLSQPNVLSLVTLPRTGQASGTFDTIEDFTGMVTAASGSQITIKSDQRGTLTASTTSATAYNGLTGSCGAAAPSASCLAVKKIISVDATVASNGVLTITEVDFLDDPSLNEDQVEGTIQLTSNPNTYGVVVDDKTLVSGNTTLQPLTSGSQISLTLDPAATFAVDTRNLVASTPNGFSSASDILTGQKVLARIKSAASGPSGISVVADRLVLRFTRTTGTVGAIGGTSFGIQALPAYFPPFAAPPQVVTFTNATTFDNVADLSSLRTADSVSIRALFLNPASVPQPFLAAKVRKH